MGSMWQPMSFFLLYVGLFLFVSVPCIGGKVMTMRKLSHRLKTLELHKKTMTIISNELISEITALRKIIEENSGEISELKKEVSLLKERDKDNVMNTDFPLAFDILNMVKNIENSTNDTTEDILTAGAGEQLVTGLLNFTSETNSCCQAAASIEKKVLSLQFMIENQMLSTIQHLMQNSTKMVGNHVRTIEALEKKVQIIFNKMDENKINGISSLTLQHLITFIKKVDCGAPPHKNGTRVSDNTGTRLGDETVYSCLPRFRYVSGKNTTSCNIDGEWSHLDLMCKEVDCGAPPHKNGTRVSDNTGTRLGDETVYSCLPRFRYVSGKNTTSCNIDGEWSHLDLMCEDETPAGKGYKYDSRTRIWYKLNMMFRNWTDAVEMCAADGARLITITNPSEVQLVQDVIDSVRCCVWIGCNRRNPAREWMWSDGKPVTWFAWSIFGPQQSDCCVQYKNIWDSHKCSFKKFFVCQIT